MITLDGYTVGKQLGGRGDSETYVAVRTSDGASVTLKQYGRAQDSLPERQQQILAKLGASGTVRALDLDRDVQPPVLVLEHVPGRSLAEALPLAPGDFLDVAIALSQTLARLHDARILHNDITPGHIVLRASDSVPVLIGFRAATRLGEAEADYRTSDIRYAGPEHSSRTNLSIDFRSDLYALGATLYHAITGSPPFSDQDRLALIHAHVARAPVSPTDRSALIPSTVSRILLKLLAKDPTHRYQTAHALEVDLVECRRQLLAFGQIEDELPLGAADAPVRPMFSRRLFGREKESETLIDAWNRRAEPRADLFVVSGGPGFGKSALIDALRVETTRSSGYIARGKFEEQREDHPYFGVVQALAGLVDQILAEGAEKLETWRERILESLGNLAQVVVAVVPDLAPVVGDVPPVPAIGPNEERERFTLAIRRFISAFATADHPLALVLEDMHWADAPSLYLTESLLHTVRNSPHLLIVGTWRDTDPAHRERLERFEARIGEARLRSERISLGPLGVEASTEMLREALRCDAEAARGLADIILKKTGGSPFLIQQFVHLAHDRGHIQYRYPDGWIWHEHEIAESDVSDDAVRMMVEKLGRLEPRSTALIELASCVGMECDADLLASLCDEPREQVDERLFALNETGLIAPCRGGFRFTHDRIREAAHALLDESERTDIRHRIARALLARLTPVAREDHVFEIADHMRAALRLLEPPDRVPFLETLTRAAQRALEACSPELAGQYVTSALEIFAEDDWNERRALCLGLFHSKSASELRLGRASDALETIEALESRELRPLERPGFATQKIEIALASDGPAAAVRCAIGEARKVGLDWPLTPSRLQVMWALFRMDRAMARTYERMLVPATDVDPRRVAQIAIMAQAGPAAAQSMPGVAMLILCLGIEIYLEHGYLGSPAFALSAYALFCVNRTRIEQAKKFADLALEWARRAPDPRLALRARFNVHVLVRPLYAPRANALQSLPAIAREAEELGSAEYHGYSILFDVCYRALGGERLSRIEEKIGEIESDDRSTSVAPLRLSVEVARASRDEVDQLTAALLALPNVGANDTMMWTYAAWVLTVYERFDEASSVLERTVLERQRTHAEADATLVRAVCAARMSFVARRYSKSARKAIRAAERSLRRYAEAGPDFVHMADFATAELELSTGRTARALSTFERAALRATECGFVHHAALAHERRAEVLLQMRRETEAEATYRQAAARYADWGATQKARGLLERIDPRG